MMTRASVARRESQGWQEFLVRHLRHRSNIWPAARRPLRHYTCTGTANQGPSNLYTDHHFVILAYFSLMFDESDGCLFSAIGSRLLTKSLLFLLFSPHFWPSLLRLSCRLLRPLISLCSSSVPVPPWEATLPSSGMPLRPSGRRTLGSRRI